MSGLVHSTLQCLISITIHVPSNDIWSSETISVAQTVIVVYKVVAFGKNDVRLKLNFNSMFL